MEKLAELKSIVENATDLLEAFAITASIDFEKSDNKKVFIRRDSDTYAEIELGGIIPGAATLLTKDEAAQLNAVEETPYQGAAGDLYRLKLRKGTKGILHYKSASVPFVLDFDQQRPFSIDMETEEVNYLENKNVDLSTVTVNQCYYWATLWDAGCCDTGVKPHKRGLVACNNGARDDRCCDGGS